MKIHKKHNPYSYGETTDAVIRNVLTKTGEKTYYMNLVGDDALLMRELVNKGIDSHLEAITGKFEVVDDKYVGKRLHCHVDHKGMICLLRRLNEHESHEAMMLRTDILSTLGIEEC